MSSSDPRPDDTCDDPLGLILPGGKVDPEALRAAYERSQSEADDEGDVRHPHVTFTLQRDLNARLDKYLTSRVAFMSRNQLQRLIDDGAVTVNDRSAKASTKLRLGDTVRVEIPPPPSKDVQPDEITFDVLYEDEHLIVINKQADLLVHPARSELRGTMINGLVWHFSNRSRFGGELSHVGEEFARPGVVHRLDRNTTGCIVFAKTDEAHWKLGQQFEHRRVDKRYIAVVQGRYEPEVDVIDLPLGPHPSREKGYREKIVVRHDDLGRPSVTIARVRERYTLPGRDQTEIRCSLVELELKTGRTHQIRVHLSHRGYPIVGDDMYGGRPFEHEGRTLIARQALHAALLAFDHPITGELMAFTAPPPEDLSAVLRALRAGDVQRCEAPGSVALSRLGL